MACAMLTQVSRSQPPEISAWGGRELPNVCPGYTTCNPNGIRLGDTVQIDICVENASEEPGPYLPPFPMREAALDATSQIEVHLMCRESQCSTAQLTGILTFVSFAPYAGVAASFAMGATSSCTEPTACGTLSLGSDVPLPATHDAVCVC